MRRLLYLIPLLILLASVGFSAQLCDRTIVNLEGTCTTTLHYRDIDPGIYSPYSAIDEGVYFRLTHFMLVPIDSTDQNAVYQKLSTLFSLGLVDALPTSIVVLTDGSNNLIVLPIISVGHVAYLTGVCEGTMSFTIDDKVHSQDIVYDESFTPETGQSTSTETVYFTLDNLTGVVSFVPRPHFPDDQSTLVGKLIYPRYNGYSTLYETFETSPMRYIDYIRKKIEAEAEKSGEQIDVDAIYRALSSVIRYLYLSNEVAYKTYPSESFRMRVINISPDEMKLLAIAAGYTLTYGEIYRPPVKPILADETEEVDFKDMVNGTYCYGVIGEVSPEKIRPYAPKELELEAPSAVVLLRKPKNVDIRISNPNQKEEAEYLLCFAPVNVKMKPLFDYDRVGNKFCVHERIKPNYVHEYTFTVLYPTSEDAKIRVELKYIISSDLGKLTKYVTKDIYVSASYYMYESVCLDDQTIAVVDESERFIKSSISCVPPDKCYQIDYRAVCSDHPPLPGEFEAREFEKATQKNPIVGFLLFGASGMIADILTAYFGYKAGMFTAPMAAAGIMAALGAIALAYALYRFMPQRCPIKPYIPILSVPVGLIFGATGVLVMSGVAFLICLALRKS